MTPARHSSPGRIAVTVLGALGIATVLAIAIPNGRHADLIAPEERTSPSDMSYRLLDGGRWSLAGHRGKVTVVNLWATWCPPCRAETPALVRVANEMTPRGVAFVGVSLDEKPERIPRFVDEYRVPYPIADASDDPRFFQGVSMPTTLVYDRQGRLASRTVGEIEEGSFRDLLRRLLAE